MLGKLGRGVLWVVVDLGRTLIGVELVGEVDQLYDSAKCPDCACFRSRSIIYGIIE